MHDFFLRNPLKFLWHGFLYRSFGGKKHELKPLGNFALSLSPYSNSRVFVVLYLNARLKSFMGSKFL
jgi:hypothetical protein